MLFTKISSFLLLISFSYQLLAADLAGLSRIFRSTFWTSHYEARYCGKNIEKLVRKAIDQRLDLSGAEIVEITDSSGWMFGMVNALQAREAGRLITPSRSHPSRVPGESNWYFHVVLKVEGKILDYDFTNKATILPMKEYLNEMFIPESKVGDISYKISKMKGYKITTYPAEDYILRLDQRLSNREISKEFYLKDYMPNFFSVY